MVVKWQCPITSSTQVHLHVPDQLPSVRDVGVAAAVASHTLFPLKSVQVNLMPPNAIASAQWTPSLMSFEPYLYLNTFEHFFLIQRVFRNVPENIKVFTDTVWCIPYHNWKRSLIGVPPNSYFICHIQKSNLAILSKNTCMYMDHFGLALTLHCSVVFHLLGAYNWCSMQAMY